MVCLEKVFCQDVGPFGQGDTLRYDRCLLSCFVQSGASFFDFSERANDEFYVGGVFEEIADV